MAYFSSGTEGMEYEEKYCIGMNCVHYGDDGSGCAVLRLHARYNYYENGNPDSFLDELIPREGTGNGKCTMLYPEKGETP